MPEEAAMDPLVELVKANLIPGSISFLLIGLMLGVILLHAGRRARRWGVRWLTALAILYLLLSLPVTAGALAAPLDAGAIPGALDPRAKTAEAVVVLGGGGLSIVNDGVSTQILSESSALRTLEGVRLYRELEDPWVIVSGGTNEKAGLTTAESEAMRDLLIENGVPPSRILVESGSQDTHDQALKIPALLAAYDIDRFVLITSPTHMLRALLSFEKAGLDPIPVLANKRSSTQPQGFPLQPNLSALDDSRTALREWMGLLYYALRGWI
jgi:uncharacterized SAM-binding protein YcdF (DUF218 family)